MSKRKPFPYQKEGVYCIEDFGNRAMLADEMGLGKSAQTLWWFKRHPEAWPGIIVCPAAVKYSWEHEALETIGVHCDIAEGRTPPRVSSIDHPPNLLIINYDILRDWWPYIRDHLKPKTMIVDELQFCKNRSAIRTKAVKKIAKKVKCLIGLSGTPLTNKPAELWPFLNMMRPNLYNSFWSYAHEFCGAKKNHWGWEFNGATNTNRLSKQLRRHGMIRRLKKDVAKDLPDKLRKIIPVPLSNGDEYLEAQDNFLDWLRKTDPLKAVSAARAEVITKLGTLKRLAAKGKREWIYDWVDKHLEQTDEKLVLFAIHKPMFNSLRERYSESVEISGRVTGRRRQAALSKFKNDKKTRLAFCQNQAAGVGVNGLQVASTLMFTELGWTPGEHIQCEDRIHRLGQKNTSWIYYIVAIDTVEEKIALLLQKKQEVLSAILDGGKQPGDMNIYSELLLQLRGG